jgi:hypothetical protein
MGDGRKGKVRSGIGGDEDDDPWPLGQGGLDTDERGEVWPRAHVCLPSSTLNFSNPFPFFKKEKQEQIAQVSEFQISNLLDLFFMPTK